MTMEKVNRIPLRERLNMETGNEPNFLKAFETYLDVYFQGLKDISGDSYFVNWFQNEVSYAKGIDDTDVLLAAIPQFIDCLPRPEKIELLITIFLKPFAMMSQLAKEVKTSESMLDYAWDI